ncbi:MAG TPA: SDR family NAD(P)-dependent oxidoreductase [Nevskiaceae bacterium]|nr:SDR family NAD(P)-dependent oxidoreductase [Nevskiaceae bacterium]
MKDFHGKVALVTGASSGIGEAIALALARAGATVVLTGRDRERLAQVEQKCIAAGGQAWSHAAEVTDAQQMHALADAVHARHEAIDILVNNAGVVMAGLVIETEPADWRRLHDINVMGVVHGCQAFVPKMIARGRGGHVINMGSASSIVGTPGMGTYCATKFAVMGLSESLRAELKRARIGVSVVCPGYVDTPIAGKVKIAGSLATDRRRAAIADRFKRNSVTAEQVAERTLGAIRTNKAVVTVGRDAAAAHFLKRWAPGLLARYAK